MTFIRAFAVALIGGVSMLSPALAQELTEEQAAEAMDFAMHDAAFTMYHEVGHLLVGELGLPVLGKEEDAADALAAILLLEESKDEDEAFNTLIDSADGWYFSAVKSTGEGVDALSYYDEHSLDIQRAYAMVCMMVGADADAFGETADIYELDKDRQQACSGTYAQARESWALLLDPHANAVQEPSTIEVVYEDAGEYAAFADELQSRMVLEKAAERVASSYALPRAVTFRATLCGQANAFYSPSEGEVIYCYELAHHMQELYAANVFGGEAETDDEDAAAGAEATYAAIDELHGDAEGFGEFFASFQETLAETKPDGFAELVEYPVEVGANGEVYDVQSAEDFTDNIAALLTDETMQALGEQSYADLVVTSDGVGFAQGAVWASLICEEEECATSYWARTSVNN
jgi:hypothetical protein